MEITEKQLKAYINKAINEELLEEGLGRSLGKGVVGTTKKVGKKLFGKGGTEKDREIMAFIQHHGDDGYRAALNNKNWTKEEVEDAIKNYNQSGVRKISNTFTGKQPRRIAAEKELSFLEREQTPQKGTKQAGQKDYQNRPGWSEDEHGTLIFNPDDLRKPSQAAQAQTQNLSSEYNKDYFEKVLKGNKIETGIARGASAVGGAVAGGAAVGKAVDNVISNIRKTQDSRATVNDTINNTTPKQKTNTTTQPEDAKAAKKWLDDIYVQEQSMNEDVGDILRPRTGLFKNRAKQNVLQQWGYEWDENLDTDTNIKNLKQRKQKFKTAGYKDYDAYLKDTPNARDVRKTTQQGPDSETAVTTETGTTTAAQPKKYNPNEPAPFANVKPRVMQFQTWFNDKMEPQMPLAVDGIWGQYTQAAWAQWLNSTNRAL